MVGGRFDHCKHFLCVTGYDVDISVPRRIPKLHVTLRALPHRLT
jgi:hypothetical protein